jgi:hypothetical protein
MVGDETSCGKRVCHGTGFEGYICFHCLLDYIGIVEQLFGFNTISGFLYVRMCQKVEN